MTDETQALHHLSMLILELLRTERKPRSMGWLAKNVKGWRYPLNYTDLIPAIRELTRLGLTREYHPSGPYGGSNRMVSLVEEAKT